MKGKIKPTILAALLGVVFTAEMLPGHRLNQLAAKTFTTSLHFLLQKLSTKSLS